MKFCKDCKHLDGWKCNSPRILHVIDAVSGEPTALITSARVQRDSSYFIALLTKTCGIAARFFQPK